MAGAGSRQHRQALREAERRLAAILRTARKLSVSPADVAGLGAARKLREAAGGGGGGAGGGRALLPLVAALGALVLLLLVCSAEPQAPGCLKNTSETCAQPATDAAPGVPQTAASDPAHGRPQRDGLSEQQLRPRR